MGDGQGVSGWIIGGVPALNEGTVFYNYAVGGNTLLGGMLGWTDVDFFFGDTGLDAYDWDEFYEVFLAIY